MTEQNFDGERVAATGERPSRILWILGVSVLLLCAVFGWRTVKARRDFDAYRQSTLVEGADKLPWKSAELVVEACIDFALEWTLACPAMDSWCHGYMSEVLGGCLDSTPRTAYCEKYAQAMALTSYGYAECDERVSRVEMKYRKRATKKICAAAHRAVVAHCAR